MALDFPDSGEEWSSRISVKAHGNVKSSQPDCVPNAPSNQEFLTAVAAGAAIGWAAGGPVAPQFSIPAAILGAISAVATQAFKDIYNNWASKYVGKGYAGCGIALAVIPLDRQILSIETYASDFQGGPLSPIAPGTWDHGPGWVHWEPGISIHSTNFPFLDPQGNTNPGHVQLIAKRFRNWKAGTIRDGQFKVIYSK